MPEASRHAKPRPAASRLKASILAAAALAGAAAAFVFLQGGPAVSKPVHSAISVTSATVTVPRNDQENIPADRRDMAILAARVVVMRSKAAAKHRAEHRAHETAARPTPQPTVQPTPTAIPTPTAQPTTQATGNAADSPLGVCVRDAEEGGSYAWGPGNGGGAYQFLLGTWEKYGGAASEYGVAGPAYQDQIFDNAVAEGGASNWTAYDGC